ncbi:MAG: DUF3592 domain-containing protein [Nevskia sp.]|nr:DUF3592 domain-containing protein [Nevskia sp.]
MKNAATAKYLLGLAGLALLAGSAMLFAGARSFIAHAARAEGVVTDLVQDADSKNQAPQVQFVDAGGHPQQFVSSLSSNPPAYARGDKVPVLYDPARPAHARIDAFFSLWGAALVAAALGLVLLAAAAGLHIAARRRAVAAPAGPGR